MSNTRGEFVPLNMAILTVSDSRTEENDLSGHMLADKLLTEGHQLVSKAIVTDDVYRMRAHLSTWIADSNVHVILVTGGTGFSPRDVTPEAVRPLLDRTIDGFGELFRAVSYETIGTSTLQSRTLAGLANRTLIFCLPGSVNACVTAWDNILKEQLDSRFQPCNFARLIRPVSGQ